MRALLLAGLVTGLVAAAPAAAQEPTYMASFGFIGVDQDDDAKPMLELEYRFRPGQHHWSPALGITASSGSTYLYGGFSRDFDIGRRWNVTIGLAGGWYAAGNGKDLGKGLEFRSAFDLSYRLREDMRLGVMLAHLSNGGVGERNPGIESLSFTLTWLPRGKR